MIIIIETVILCIAFFLICFWGTGTDNKNLKSYSSYPDEVQNRIKSIAEYQGKFKESNKVVTFSQNNSYIYMLTTIRFFCIVLLKGGNVYVT